MIDFIKVLYGLYKATKGVNKTNKDGDIRLYNCVENDKFLYIVVSKDVCRQYHLNPDIRFIGEGGDDE